MNKLTFSLLACLSLSVAACGKVVQLTDGDGGALVDGGSGDGGNNGADADINNLPCEGPIAFEDLPGCLVAAQCEQFVRCAPLFTSVEECIEVLPSIFGEFDQQLAIFGFGIEAGKINYDADAAVDCLASFSGSSCENEGGDDECEPVFRGDTAPNATCLEDAECAILGSDCDTNGSKCNDNDACCLGFCQPPVGIGGDCSFARCEPGAHCVRSQESPNNEVLCQPGDAGSPCENNFECDNGFFCGFVDAAAGACQPTRPTGAACNGNDDECSGDDHCVLNECAPVDTVGDDCQGNCIGSLACINGQCEGLPGLGDDCAAFGQCNSFSLDCFGIPGGPQTCVEKQGLGQPCVERECLPGFICESDLPNPPMLPTCVERLGVGESCERDSNCQDSSCVFNPQAGQSFCGAPINCYEQTMF